MRVTTPPSCSIQGGGLDSTQYAKGRYAIREHPVISYADNKFTFKRYNFHQETQPTLRLFCPNVFLDVTCAEFFLTLW